MPFLRTIRDKRGYETTYLMHLYRDGQRQRSRILYVFRSPGGVRVGRTALDPDVVREIEAQHPEIAFDWKDVREHQQHIEMAAEPRRRRLPRKDDVPAPAAEVPAEEAPAAAPRPVLPAALEGTTPDEQLAFLAHWYPVVRETVPQRISDPARLEALLALAERLNPAAWTDADEIAAGLQQAGEALERLSRVFASRRRRRTRRRPAGAPPPAPVLPSSSES